VAYIKALAEQQIDLGADVSMEVETFSHWAVNLVNQPCHEQRRARGCDHALCVGGRLAS